MSQIKIVKHAREALKRMRKELPEGVRIETRFSSAHYKFAFLRGKELLGFVIVSGSPRSADNEIKAAIADARRVLRIVA